MLRFVTLCTAVLLAFPAAAQKQKPLDAEERAARKEAKRGGLDEGQSHQYEANRLARCTYLKGEDKSLCERRMRGEGTTSGSVESGGIYRELIIREPAERPSAGSSSPIAE